MHQVQHIPSFIEALAPIIRSYGYIAVFTLVMLEDFGIPAPGETVLIASAFYAGLVQLSLPLVILYGFLGAVVGDNIGFAIGHYGGHPLVERYGKYVFLTPERLNKAELFFKKQGGKVVIVARFIEGLRQLNGILAGLSEMPWVSFLTFNAIGAALWASAWSFLGYFGGNHIDTFLHYQLYLSIVAGAALVGYVLYRVLKRRRNR